MELKEKIEMYQEKKNFVAAVSKAFESLRHSSVEKITYEIFTKDINGEPYFKEWLVVHFNGGAISVRTCTGNSNSANFREIGKLVDGGYYNEVDSYENMETLGFKVFEI
jgi:hypothetical protein